MQPRSTSTILLVALMAAAPSLLGCAASAPPPDFRILERPPIMSEAAEDQAAQQDGTPLAEFGWSCLSYSAYIEELRRGR